MRTLILSASAILALSTFAGENNAPTWPAATRDAKPWVYNWWMASAVDRIGLEAQCAALEEGGFGGFHVIPIYGAKGYESKTRVYLTPPWMEAFADAVRIGAAHGLGVDMTMGCGWCFGGPQLTPDQGCWKFERVPDGKPPYLTWKRTGQQVKRAGPGGKGPMMDPFSKCAMEAFLKPFSVFDAPSAVRPEHVYHDSWEYFFASWSPELFDAFKAKRGYDLRDHLKELAGLGKREDNERVRVDYYETLSDIVVDDTFPMWIRWAHAHGIKTRNEAHGTCANWLDFYALADMPETEMFDEGCRDILVSKFASSSAHVTGKILVSSESCTWLADHFTETLSDFKVLLDRLFLSGVNHIYYHGCCYSPVDAVWPGWCFYASSEMNPRNPIWHDVKYLSAYVTRCQSMFQACAPDEDTLVYWPVRDYWAKSDGFENSMSVHNAGGWFHAQPIGETARRLAKEGRAFDYVSDRQLQSLDLSRYADIVVPPCRWMPAKTAEAIKRFVRRPARIEPFPSAGLTFTRFRRGTDAVYFVVNTNSSRVVSRLMPSCGAGRAWMMDPMDGAVREVGMDEKGVSFDLEAFASVFLVVRSGEKSNCRASAPSAKRESVTVNGPWKLTAIEGGPTLPEPRTMAALTSWSRREDGGEEPFCGTMRYETTFDANATEGETVLDLGDVRDSARVKVNGSDVGFAFMAPYRVKIPAKILRAKGNVLTVDVTNTGANRIRFNDQSGVRWKYFTDANVIHYRYTGPFDASKWPLRDAGLLGPVTLAK